MFAFVGLAVAPALGGASAAPTSSHVTAKKTPKPACKQTKKGKNRKKARCAPPKKKKKPTKKPTKTPVKKAPKKTPTRVPTATDTPTPTPTLTPTATATVTPTATPAASVSTLSVRDDLQYGYQAALFICGLPPGVTATFSPNPAAAITDPTSPLLAAAHSTLSVSTPTGTPSGAYSLALHAYYADHTGQYVQAPPGGASIQPTAVTLTVDASGQTTLTPLAAQPAVGLQNCSAVPPGFGPPPTPTPNPAGVAVIGWVSDPHPAAGELETVYGNIKVSGQPVSQVIIHTHWYFPNGIRSCDAMSGNDGTGSCSLLLGQMLPGQTVQIQLVFNYNNQQYFTYTSFTT